MGTISQVDPQPTAHYLNEGRNEGHEIKGNTELEGGSKPSAGAATSDSFTNIFLRCSSWRPNIKQE